MIYVADSAYIYVRLAALKDRRITSHCGCGRGSELVLASAAERALDGIEVLVAQGARGPEQLGSKRHSGTDRGSQRR